jgi:hypothetical protein
MTKDSLIGVRNELGVILIKPRKLLYYGYHADEIRKPIREELIYLDADTNDNIEPNSCGVVYNRSGNLLFSPFFFDNGPDGFSEGLMRFVKKGKTGFVNRKGDVVIEAKYDYVDMFNYGLAAYCNGCVWKQKGEHRFVTGGQWGYINYKGDTIGIMNYKKNEKDQVVDSAKFLPYQFSYSQSEQKILDSFYRLPMISKTHFVNNYSTLDSNELQLHYEIVERPSAFYPYYQVMAFEYTNMHGFYGSAYLGQCFFVDSTGRDFFVFDYYNKKIPLGKWLKKEVENAKRFLKTHPDAIQKF